MNVDVFLPAECDPARVVARVGLISDTHMPERCLVFPESLFDVLDGVDFILHAGDVGELWVLDRLSAVAPVVAVHGNDDTEAAKRELPYQQIIAIEGQRVLLWHSHYPDPAEDLANRGQAWHVIKGRQAERGLRAGANVVVFGHAHIPLKFQIDGVLIVNPGALASGGLFTRQKYQTVALLFLRDDGAPFVTHVDCADPRRAHNPYVDWEVGFEVALGQTQEMIVEPDLIKDVRRLREIALVDLAALVSTVLPLAHQCWAGKKQTIERCELINAIRYSARIPPSDRDAILAILYPDV